MQIVLAGYNLQLTMGEVRNWRMLEAEEGVNASLGTASRKLCNAQHFLASHAKLTIRASSLTKRKRPPACFVAVRRLGSHDLNVSCFLFANMFGLKPNSHCKACDFRSLLLCSASLAGHFV